MCNLNTFVSEDKQKTPKQCHILILLFLHQSLPSQSASRSKETAKAILVVCIWGPVCTKGCHSDCCLREEETRSEDQGKGGTVSTGEISSQQRSVEKTRAKFKCQRRKGGEVRLRRQLRFQIRYTIIYERKTFAVTV